MEIIAGGRANLAAVAHFITDTPGPLHGEVFRATEAGVVDAFASRAGRETMLLADPENFGTAMQSTKPLERAGVQFIEHGELPGKVHTKLLHDVQRDRTLFTTAGWTDDTLDNAEFGIVLEGAQSRVAREVTDASLAGDVPRLRDATRAAAKLDVLFNDAQFGIDELSRGADDLIENSRRRLTIGVKWFRREELAGGIAKRSDHVDTTIAANDFSGEVERVLRKAGLDPVALGKGKGRSDWHANVIVGDDTVLVSTHHLTDRGMDPSEATSKSREVGVRIHDRQLADHFDQLIKDRITAD